MKTRSRGQARTLYYEAQGLPVDARSEFLDQVCGGDMRLRGEVESLLRADRIRARAGADAPTEPGLRRN